MFKAKIISLLVKFIMGAIALGIGIWYVSSSINGDAITYTSLNHFMSAIGVQNNDISSANGCFLCVYIEKLFHTIGVATESFWRAMISNIWILIAIGFGIFLFVHSGKYLYEASKKNAALDESERKLDFAEWFKPVQKQLIHILIAGALLGALGFGGTTALRTVSSITITPVMYVGSELSMAATGVAGSAQCGTSTLENKNDILNPVLKPFMCTVGNLNTVMLAGAAGGFSLMNYSYMGMGGGAFTWVAGLALVIMFLVIGFNIFFKIFSVIFKLIFLIIFLPFIIAAAAFESTWPLIKNVVSNAINMLVKSAIKIVAITLEITIVYAIVSFAADQYFPGPNDGYNAIMPPMIETQKSTDDKTLSIISVFSKCETIATESGQMDKEKFTNCFTASRAEVERSHPDAFDFMENGFEFLMIMIGIFFLYFYIISDKIDSLLGAKDDKEEFDFGKWMKDFGQTVWNSPAKIASAIEKAKKD